VAFATGDGLLVSLDKIILPDGQELKALSRDPAIPSLVTAIETQPGPQPEMLKVYQALLADPELMLALNDLIATRVHPHYAVINCARVIDSIKSLIAPDEKDDNRAWPKVHAALNVDEPYLKYISKASRAWRHGHRKPVLGST